MNRTPRTLDERRAGGRKARELMPRDGLAGWDTARERDPLATLRAQEDIRLSELPPIRYGRMAISPWNYYRGAAAVMATDLASRPATGLSVQLCGDAHVLNFGLWATPERQLAFDARDFDETLPGPFEWDFGRLVASLVVLARDADVKPRVAERAVGSGLRAYRERIADLSRGRQLDVWHTLDTAEALVSLFRPEEQELISSHISRKARKRTSRGVVRKLTEKSGGRLRITDDPPLRVHLTDDELAVVSEVFAKYRRSLPAYRRYLLDRFTFVDGVRQIVGVGSVGMRVYLTLLQGRDGDDPLFLQIKQASTSVYESHRAASRYRNHGERVVVGKRLIQSATDVFAGWTAVDGHDFYVRQFRDMKVVPRAELIAPRLAEFADACGRVLARAHAKTGDAAAIAAYVGKGRRFDEALAEFAVAYADQTEADHRALVDAIDSGPAPAAAP